MDEIHRAAPAADHERPTVRNLTLRRAVMRVLLRADGPVRVADIVRALEDDEHFGIADHHVASASQRVSNLLGWQLRRGRVRRVARGIYVAVPDAIPRTTRWRIEHWDELV
ncbi:hypothetical protein [Ilumatobacter nonamiensis]|uniref:hypothetical protein n=1 Tax=Ilumatobacter nonamiensis TaxID=467093 RepID=UPI00034C4483|nr:hypothetical protein [Ilumatobacter nonamiensis]